MNRYTTALNNSMISFAVFLVLAELVTSGFSPGFFFTIDRGWEGMGIMASIWHFVLALSSLSSSWANQSI